MGNVISWNVTNWVTVFLMASVGMMVFGLAAGAYRSAMGEAEA